MTVGPLPVLASPKSQIQLTIVPSRSTDSVPSKKIGTPSWTGAASSATTAPGAGVPEIRAVGARLGSETSTAIVAIVDAPRSSTTVSAAW